MLKKNTYTPKRSKTIDSPQPTPKHKTQTNPPISTTQPTSTTTQKPATKKWANKPRILRSPKFPVLTKFAKFRYTKRFIAFIMAFMVLATSVALDAFAFGADVIVAINNPVPAFTVDEGGAFPTHNTTHATVSHTGTGAGSLQAAITAVGSPTVAQPGGSFDNPFIIGITADLHLTATQASTAGITASQQNRGRYIRFVPMNGNRQITVSGNFRHFSFSGTTHLQISGNNQTTGTTGQHTLTLMGRGNQPGGGVLVNTQGIPTGVVGNQTATPASFRLMPGGRITNVQQSGNGGAVLVQGHSQFIMDGGIISNNQAVMGGAVRADTGGVFIMNAGIIENNRATQDTGWWHTPNNPNGGGGVSINGAAIQQNTNNHANWSARRSSFTMNNGTIQNNHSTRGSGGGVGVQARGLFTMNGGNILNNQASDVRDNGHQRDGSGGGGVDVNGGFILQGQIQVSDPAVGFRAGNARFIMNGGNIDGNRAMYGGAVRVSQSAYFEFNNGQLSNNNATVSSGAVHIRENSLMNMNGGEIFGNIARGAGGWLIDIRSNNNYGYGGGVHLYSWNATFNMNGGTIHNNTAGIGGGIGALNSFLNIGTGWNTHGSPSIPGVATGAGLSGRPFTNAQIIPNRADTTNTTVPLNGTPRIHSNLSTNASDDLHNNNVNRTGGYAPLTYGGGGGGGVYYYAFAWDFGQRFVLGNAIIENNRSQLRGGGVFLVEGAMFMQDGARIRNNHTIRQHNVNNAGGGIAIMNHVAGTRTRFIMNGGEIYDNTARNGGGLARVAAQGFQSTMNRSVIHLHNGTIRNNTAVYFGGGVFTENFSRASGMPGITLAPTQSAVRNNRDNLFVSPQMVFAGNEAHEFSLALANFQVQQHANVGNVNSGTNMNNTATLRPNVQWQGNNSIPSVWSDLETFTALFAHLGLPLTDPVPLGWTGWSLFNNHDIDNGVGRHVPIFDPPEDGRVAIAITPDDNGTLDDGGVYINLQPDGGWEDPIVEISEDANGNPEEVVITLIPRPGTSVDDENIYVLLPPEWTYVTERDENGNIIITATPPPNR
ncbi:MAG: hypothetical protein FWG68_06760, partial [Defluviitaleaceae bacterium]|nr:hypothetical protein [Defluviitaleaceae bacterium]